MNAFALHCPNCGAAADPEGYVREHYPELADLYDHGLDGLLQRAGDAVGGKLAPLLAATGLDQLGPTLTSLLDSLRPDELAAGALTGCCECFEKALKLNPALNEARYRLTFAQPDEKRRIELLAEFNAFLKSDQFDESRIRYAEMGKYGDVIGRDPVMQGKPVVGPLPLFEDAKLTVTL